ncbi:hypothetical protein Csa_015881 [Cucumis sativus]|uniref:Uncharacterized protein n=1 Tax=Cucumis sativus TaxID=3659 RepID=A0A0A0K4I4_CUCSA|nr:hypothetical protein Csa_015881 [Cucumis sativus]
MDIRICMRISRLSLGIKIFFGNSRLSTEALIQSLKVGDPSRFELECVRFLRYKKLRGNSRLLAEAILQLPVERKRAKPFQARMRWESQAALGHSALGFFDIGKCVGNSRLLAEATLQLHVESRRDEPFRARMSQVHFVSESTLRTLDSQLKPQYNHS